MTRRISRRALLTIGGAAAVVAGLRALPWDRLFPAPLTYRAIEGRPPFRELAITGRLSSAGDPLFGLRLPDNGQAEKQTYAAQVGADLCGALFGGWPDDGVLPIAYFADVKCPVCRVLEKDLDALLSVSGGSLRLIQHELPVFGPSSELAARASVAAAFQGKQQALRARLMRSALVPDPTYLVNVAADLGIDGDQLLRDMESEEVRVALGRSRALAGIFGFIGTPGLVIGRTAILGGVPRSVLERVIAEEPALPVPDCEPP
jgi:predicted DsbA family dithiol-disulfide isomerase